MGSFIFLASYHDRFWFKIKWNYLHLSLLLPTTASRWQQTLPPSSVLVCLLITNKYKKLHRADDIWLKWACSSLKTMYWRCYHKLHMSSTHPWDFFLFFLHISYQLAKANLALFITGSPCWCQVWCCRQLLASCISHSPFRCLITPHPGLYRGRIYFSYPALSLRETSRVGVPV